jgi:stress response protein YsnF
MTRGKKNSKRKTLPKNNNITSNNTDYSNNNNNNNNLTNSPSNLSAETVKIIPVMEENFDLSKKTIVQETKIMKRLTTKTEKIEVPITYEEVYVNDKKLNIYDKEGREGLLSKLKDTVAHSIASDDSNIEYHYPHSSSSDSPDSPDLSSSSTHSAKKSGSQNQYHDDNYNNREGELVPLIEGQEKNGTEKIVPIWGEEIIVSKRKVKLGEIIIRRRRIIENKKIDVDIKKEKVIVEYPNGVKEELTTTASSSSSSTTST